MTFALNVSATVQTATQFTTGGGSVAGLKPQKRTFSLTGLLGTVIMPGDAVAIWGSNDGGSTYQPLRQNGQQVLLNYNFPEIVIDDCCDHYATNRVAVGQGSTLANVGLNGEAAANPLVQAGSVTLASGIATVSGKILTSASVVVPAVVDQGGTMTDFASLDVTVNVGAQTIAFAAKKDDDTLLAAASPVVNYIIVG